MKRIALLIGILLSTISMNSQIQATDIAPSAYEVQLIPANPQVSELGKFGSVPINKYNGTANIDIPIYQVELDGMVIPLSLRYNTSGVRVNQDASWVGLGWSLSDGIVITREVNGFEDIRDSSYETESKGWIYSEDFLDPIHQFTISETNLNFLSNQYQLNKPHDTEPDVFSVRLPTGHFKFYLPKKVGSEQVLEAKVIDNKNFIVKYDISDQSFEVKDKSGFTYYFDAKEFSTGYSSWSSPTAATEQNALRGIPTWSTNQTREMISSWKVSKIQSFLGKEIDFTYFQEFHLSYPQYTERASFTANNGPTTETVTHNLTSPQTMSASINAFHKLQLTSISGDFGSINFTLTDRIDLFSIDAKIEHANESVGTWNIAISPNTYNAKKLDKIQIKDSNSNIVSETQFNYSYFNNHKLSDPLKESYLRLKLDGVQVADKNYSFEYEGPNLLPAKNSKSVDFWGFYNGVSNTTRIPSSNRFYANHGTAFVENGNNYYAYESFIKVNGAQRNSDINYGKIGSLTKVIYPTGGSSEFEYEGNSVTLQRVGFSPSYFSNGRMKYSGLTSSEGYNFRYQMLKLAEDPTYSLYDYNNCSINTSNISSNNTNFTITDELLCNGQQYNIQVNATLSCSVGCNQGISPTGPAVWIENTQSGEIIDVFSFDGQFNVNTTSVTLEKNISLPAGSYKFVYASWSTSTPFLVVATTTASASYWENIGTPAVVFEEFEVGGPRVKKVIHKDFNGDFITGKQFVYEKTINGSSLSSGKLMDDLIYHFTGNNFYEYSPEAFENDIKLVSVNKLRTQFSAQGSHVGYDQVLEETINENNGTNGSILSNYVNEVNANVERWIGVTIGEQSTGYDVFYDDVYIIGASPVVNQSNGMLIEESIFDSTGNEKSHVQKKYKEIIAGYAPVHLYPILFHTGNVLVDTYPYINVGTSILKNNRVFKLESSITNQFLDGQVISDTTNYYYDNWTHLELTKIESIDSKGNSLIQKNYYPQDTSTGPFMSDLIFDNRVAKPVINESFINKNEVPASNDILLSTQKTEFSDLYNVNNFVLPYKVTTQKGTSDQKTEIVYEKYDDYGNLLQYKKPDGTTTTFIWGYNQQYPIAKIENFTSSQAASIQSSLIDPAIAASDNDSSAALEDVLRTELGSLRDDSALSDAMITTYTYDPLIGVTSMTAPTGYTTYYQYDSDNRLQYITDKDEKVVKSFDYNYKQIIPQYTITSTTNGNGTVSLSDTEVNEGENVIVTVTPNSGYQISMITVNGTSHSTSSPFTLSNITSNTIIDVQFSIIPPSFSVSPTSMSFDWIDGNKTATVTAGGSWTVSKSASWITISATSGSGNGTFTIRPIKNNGSQRSGTVTVTQSGTSKTIYITQSAGESGPPR